MRIRALLTGVVLLLLSFSLQAQLISGRAAADKIEGTAMLRYADNNALPQYILLAADNTQSFADGPLWLDKQLDLPEGTSFEVLNDDVDRHGNRHVRLQQYVDGHEVRAGQMILHGNGTHWDHATGELFAPDVGSAPVLLSGSQAIAIGLDELPAGTYGWETTPVMSDFPTAKLTWIPQDLAFNVNGFQLAYAVKIYSVKPLAHKTLYVDAATGNIIAREEHIHTHENNSPETVVPGTAETAYSGTRDIETTLDGDVYVLNDDTRGDGIETYNCQATENYLFVNFEDDDNFWNNVNPQQDEVATDAHWGAAAYFDYLLGLGRNSIDNNGEAIESHVHYGFQFGNAFWDGSRMTYGDGEPGGFLPLPLTSIDVVAHEITHGLTERTSGLIYNGESGALNESFSDVFGAILNFHTRPNEATWIIGADITDDGNGIRNMRDPNIHDNPGNYDGAFWTDGGGVHSNSGVQNHWFQLLTDGETSTNEAGFAYDLRAMALDTTAEIAYQSNAFYLTPASNYQDAGFNSVLAAGNLYGSCSQYIYDVFDAWQAVNVIFGFPGVTSATFNLEDDIVCDPTAEVQFNNTSFADNFIWEFGDGATSTEVSPTHVYGAEGSYDVTLTAFGGQCNNDTVVSVYENAVVVDVDNIFCTSFTLDSDQTVSECSGVLFDSGGPDGAYQNGENFTFTILNPAAGSIELTMTFFETESNFDFLRIYDGTATDGVQIANLNGIHTGEIYTTTGSVATLVFTSDGSVTRPGFEITWGNGQGAGPADASFSADNTTPLINQPVTFDPSSADSQELTYDFGDGSPQVDGDGPTVHQFQSEGTYTVMAIDNNCSEQDTFSVEVIVAPATTYTIDPLDICDTLLTDELMGHDITITNTGTEDGYIGILVPDMNPFFEVDNLPASDILPAGQSVTITVNLDATGLFPATYEEFIQIQTSDATEPTYDLPVKLRVIGTPGAAYDPTFLNFGQVFTNQTSFEEFTIFSTGTDSLYVTGFTSSNPLFATASVPTFGIASGQDSTIRVDFLGTPDADLYTGVLTVMTNAGNQNISYIIEVVDAPVASVTPDSICVTLNAGDMLDTALVITNTGLSALAYQISASSSQSSTVNYVGAGASTNHVFTDLPALNGTVLQIGIQGDYEQFNESVSLNINGVNYGILSDNNLNNELDVINFPLPVGVGADGTLNITLLNSFQVSGDGTTANLHQVTVSIPQPEWLISNQNPTLLSPGATFNYPVTLDATELNGGTYTSILNFTSNDPQLENKAIPVKLIVIGIPALAVDRDTLDFGGVQLTTSEIQTLRVLNPGSDDLIIESLTIGSGQYAADQFNFTVPPDEFLDVNVIFAPSIIGPLNTTLTLSGPTHTLVVPILGTGLPVPEGSLNRDTICVTLLGGESTTELLQLANLGQGELEYTTGVGGIGTNALVWFNPASVNQQSLDNMLSVLEDPASLLDVTVTSTINGAEMAELLENTNYLVFPDMGFIPFTIDTDIGGAILPWLQAGGKIISAGNDQSGVLTDMNLVNAFFHTGIFGDDEINVIESGHPLLENVQLPLDIVGGFSGIVGVPVNDPNTTIIVSNTFAPDEGLIFTQNNVDGEVIFLGNNYDELTQNNETILRNALTYSRVEVPFPVWLSVDNTDGTLDPGSTTDVNVTFDAGTLPGATYTFPLTYNYNQPTNNLGLIYLKMIVATAPITAFSSTNEISCDGTVNFFDESLQNPTSWEWDFGDGNGSTEQNPVHNYSANGTYTVSLTTCNELGCTTEEIVDFILVDLTNPFCLQTVFEDNESVDLNGCGGIIFSTGFPGSYPNGVSSDIHITSGNGGPLRITVNSFQLEGCCDFLRVYDGSDATATLIGEYNGTDLLPGDLIESTGGELFLTFTTDGSVTLPGFELLWQCSDAVSNVVLGAEQEQGCPATYMFEAFNGLPEYTYNWDFGDGSTTTGPGMHLHTYAGTGPYTVTLMVSNDGDEYMTQTNLNVTGLNLPLGIIGPDTVEIDQVATFEKDGTDLLNTFDWTTSDGSTGSGETFMTSWPAVGTYEVRLDAGSDEVCSAAVIKEVVVVEGVNVRDAESVNSLNLFPNPVNQTLYFELETSLVSELRYRIVDVLGRTVVESQRGLLNGGAPVAVEVGQLPASTYALVIFDGSGRRLATRRFVKQ